MRSEKGYTNKILYKIVTFDNKTEYLTSSVDDIQQIIEKYNNLPFNTGKIKSIELLGYHCRALII